MADALFGALSPSGKLPYTVYGAEYAEQCDFLDMSMQAGPGRTYRFYNVQPLWPFGHGLTYGRLRMELLDWSPDAPLRDADARVSLQLWVINEGGADTEDVLMAFITPGPDVLYERPPPRLKRQLVGFERITPELKRGERRLMELTFTVREALALVDGEGHIVIAPGSYTLNVTNGVGAYSAITLRWAGEEVIVEQFPDVDGA